jgi:hypothetical protein
MVIKLTHTTKVKASNPATDASREEIFKALKAQSKILLSSLQGLSLRQVEM